jgi:hypothetical protein
MIPDKTSNVTMVSLSAFGPCLPNYTMLFIYQQMRVCKSTGNSFNPSCPETGSNRFLDNLHSGNW